MATAINYIELPAKDLEATKEFFTQAFEWQFTDYGPDYSAFSNSGLEGGFFRSELKSDSSQLGAALVVLYSENLEATQSIIEAAGGSINQAIFSFPGGRRFHFIEPSGNELAVWSER